MKRRAGVISVLALLVTGMVTAAQPESRWVCPDGFQGQELSVWNWSTYIAENTIRNFEDACGVTVDYDLFANNEEVMERLALQEGDFDVVVPSDYAVGLLISEGLLQPLDHEAIPNLVNLSPSLKNPPFDPGNVYSVAYQWGTISVGYNTALGAITSWQQVFGHDGPVAWLDDQRIMMGIALRMLGYDANSQSEAEILAGRDFLLQNSDNVIAIAEDDGQALLAGGYVDIAVEYSGDIFQIIEECGCEDYAFTIPEEGALLWTDNLVIPADAPNPELANIFIDYILDPVVGAEISNEIAYASPNEAAIERGYIPGSMLGNTIIYPSVQIRERLFLTERTPESQALFAQAWQDVLDAVG